MHRTIVLIKRLENQRENKGRGKKKTNEEARRKERNMECSTEKENTCKHTRGISISIGISSNSLFSLPHFMIFFLLPSNRCRPKQQPKLKRKRTSRTKSIAMEANRIVCPLLSRLDPHSSPF